MGIKDLSLAKHSLMPKHIFKYLKNDNSIWVDILKVKYGKINFWHDDIPAKCSWFFRGLCYSASFIKHCCKINSVNPELTSFLWDTWIFDIPVVLKPTYINMNVDLTQTTIYDLVSGDHWDLNALTRFFGDSYEIVTSNLITDELDSSNNWIWLPKPICHKISPAIYHHFNKQSSFCDNWIGWNLLWQIPVAPRVKHFIWLFLKGRLSTFAFLYNLNLGPDRPCIFCGLHCETINHLFNSCVSAQYVWNQINIRTN